jgi:hypothetical protein
VVKNLSGNKKTPMLLGIGVETSPFAGPEEETL